MRRSEPKGGIEEGRKPPLRSLAGAAGRKIIFQMNSLRFIRRLFKSLDLTLLYNRSMGNQIGFDAGRSFIRPIPQGAR